jgi:hypothetical protein
MSRPGKYILSQAEWLYSTTSHNISSSSSLMLSSQLYLASDRFSSDSQTEILHTFFIYFLFFSFIYNAVNNSDYTEPKGRIINEWWIDTYL